MKVDYPFWKYVRRFFEERLLREQRATPNTVATYRDALLLLLRFVEEQEGCDPDKLGVEHIDADLVKRFVTFQKERRGNNVSSYNTRLTAIRSFFRYVGESEPNLRQHCWEVCRIPNRSIRNEENRRKDSGYLTREEIEALIGAPNRSSWLGQRDRTLLLLMVGTGLRISEVIGLRLRDVDIGTGVIVKCSAGSPKERKILLPQRSAQALQNWVTERRGEPDDPLFMSTHGKALSRNTVQHLVRKYAERAAKECQSLHEKRVTPQALRRTFARQLGLAGQYPDQIRRLLGHKFAGWKETDVIANVGLREGAEDPRRLTDIGDEQSTRGNELVEFLKTL